MMEYLLGIDVGTTATKGIVLHPERGIVAECEQPATLRSPHAGWAEEYPAEWWANAGAVCQRCLQQAGLQASQVAAIGVSGMVPTLILLDAAGEPLYPSIQQNDARAVVEIGEQRAKTDAADVLRRTGSAITQQSIGPKVQWLLRHRSEQAAQAHHLLGSYDYIVYRLTGRFSCERNWALESGLYDLERESWDAELLELAGVPRAWLGELHASSDLVGKVSAMAASHIGVLAGTPVVAGSADHIASAFSAGLKDAGDLLVKLGGAGDILYALDQPVVDARLFLDYHVIPGKYFLNGCMAASGSIIKWFRSQLAGGMGFEALDREGSAVPAGSEGLILLPYFLGEKTPIQDPLARGVLFGLTLSHTRGHVYRAILEGIAYGFQHHLAVMAECGLPVRRARVTNGGARSQLWKQVTADVLNLPLEVVAGHPGSSLGAAFVAGKGVGLFGDWSEIERFVRVAQTVTPDAHAHQQYLSLFDIYRELYETLRKPFEHLADVQSKGSGV